MSYTGSAPISAVLTDHRGYAISGTTPIPVNPAEAGAANMGTAQVSVASAATQIVASNSTRRAVCIVNTDTSKTVYLGSSGVTALTGHALPAGSAITIPLTIAIYGITATGTAAVTEIEVFD